MNTTSVRVHVKKTFANPHLTCGMCDQPVEAWHDNDECGCTAGYWLLPCRHQADAHNWCRSWSPVDGCTCTPPCSTSQALGLDGGGSDA